MRLSLLVWALLSLLSSFAQNVRIPQVALRIDKAYRDGVRFQTVQLLERVDQNEATDVLWQDALTQATVLKMDQGRTATFIRSAPDHIAFEVPMDGGNMIIDLQKAEILAPGFELTLSDGSFAELPAGVHYRGVVRGTPGSLAAISIFDGQVMGIIGDASGEMVLGPFEQGPAGLHILYRSTHLKGSPNSICHTQDDGIPYSDEDFFDPGNDRSTRCVRFYWEIAYAIVQNKGSVAAATTYMTGVFNQSAILFDNDGIDVTLQEMFVWNSASPYDATTSQGRLNQFGTVRTSFNGDLAHLIDLSSNLGGIAWLNTLCSSTTSQKMAYSGIDASYSNVPTYSWTVNVVTHEQGHNMGSRHTHACVWNGNNTAIDGCGQAAGYSEGGCPQGPLPSSSVGGTIMSYCHLTSSTIKFANGFGPQPTTVILNRVNTATCLPVCGSSCDAPSSISVITATTSATITWATTGASSYQLDWKPASSGTWTTVSGITGTSHQLTGLAPGTTYDYRVRSVCGTDTSPWSATNNFTTPVPCTDSLEPNNSTLAAALITLPASISALIASSSDVDYYRFVTDQTANLSITLTNLPADYDLRLLNSTGSQIALSENGGTISESITLSNQPAGTYYIHVFGWSGAFNTTQCYQLTASASGTQGCGIPTGLNATNITTTSATISWSPMQGASSYGLEWKEQTAPTWNTVGPIAGTSHVLNGLTPGTTYSYRVRSNCTGGSSLYGSTASFTTVADPCASGVRVSAFVWLDGALPPGSSQMTDNLRSLGHLPLTEPYTTKGYQVSGPTATTQQILSTTGSQAVVDWVLVELRSPSSSSTVVACRAGLLRRDGSIVDPETLQAINFCLPAGNYFVAVRHRNHLGCMTSSAIGLSSSGTTVDFRTSATATFGVNARRNANGSMRLWAGNVNGDNMVKYTGEFNDRDQVLAEIGGVIFTSTVNGYKDADTNLDGVVKYTGEANDRDVILGTVGGLVMTAIMTQQLP